MKKLFYLLLLCVSFIVSAQSVKLSTKIPGIGSTISTSIPVDKVFNLDVKTPKTKEQCLAKSEITSNTAQYKNVNHKVYATNKGKLFIVLPNKEGTGYYKKYIKTE